MQTDLFGNVVEQPEKKTEKLIDPAPAAEAGLSATRNIHNTPHNYVLVNDAAAIDALVKELQGIEEICFDTDTTHIDPMLAELVGIRFSYKAGEGYYIPCPADRKAT